MLNFIYFKMYVVVDFKGHQYIVKQGDKIIVDRLQQQEWDIIDVNTVVLAFDEKGEDVKVWQPYLKDANVTFKVLQHIKGDKIHVIKFKNKNRYSRKIWFRPKYTVLQVENIKVNG